MDSGSRKPRKGELGWLSTSFWFAVGKSHVSEKTANVVVKACDLLAPAYGLGHLDTVRFDELADVQTASEIGTEHVGAGAHLRAIPSREGGDAALRVKCAADVAHQTPLSWGTGDMPLKDKASWAVIGPADDESEMA